MIWAGEINDAFVKELLESQPRNLVLSTVGGDIYSMLAAIDHLDEVPTPVMATGLVASAGILVLASGKKGERSATPRTRFMIHKPCLEVSSDADTVRVETSEMSAQRDLYWRVLCEKTGKRQGWWEKKCEKQPWYFGADEALSVGLIDSVRPAK